MQQGSRTAVLEGNVGKTLIELAAPSVIGITAILMFQAVDAFFVAQLGVLPLAAMSYTFPVTMVIANVAIGLSIGATAVISRAVGRGDEREVRRLTTDLLTLSVVVVTLLGVAGLWSMDWVFPLLGASEQELPLIREYMTPWTLGVGLLVIPMVGNGAIRATGDTRSPMLIMLVSGLVNLVLDPFLIFGWGPFPRLELQGAAIATVVSWVVTFVAAYWVLHHRERMLDFSLPKLHAVLRSWRRILRIGLPSSLSNVLVPLGAGVLTRMVSSFGPEAVAAFGIGSRVEGLAMIGSYALSMAATPFVGQNFGAGQLSRIAEAVRFLTKASLGWGAAIALSLGVLAGPLAGVWSDGPLVVGFAERYLTFIPWSYGPLGLAIISGAVFNALDSPLHSVLLIIARLFVFVVPLAALGASAFGVDGLLLGMAAGYLCSGVLAWALVQRHSRRLLRGALPLAA